MYQKVNKFDTYQNIYKNLDTLLRNVDLTPFLFFAIHQFQVYLMVYLLILSIGAVSLTLSTNFVKNSHTFISYVQTKRRPPFLMIAVIKDNNT